MSLTSTLQAIQARIKLLMAYVPLVQSTVLEIESEMPGASGTSKAQAALMIILSVAHAGETVPIAAVQVISALIDTAVSTFNALGIFKKSSPVTTVTVPAIPAASVSA
jgi:hypothetical protein